MMPPFRITLVNEKTRLYDRFAVFILLINTAAILSLFFVKGQPLRVKIAAGLALVILASAITVYSRAAWRSKRTIFFLLATAIAVLCWMISGIWWAGIVTLLLAGLYQAAQKVPVVTVENNRILYPSFPARNIPWQSLNNILLKDGLLTIDLKNNTLIQQAVDEKNTAVNEPDFNEFCRQRLVEHAAK